MATHANRTTPGMIRWRKRMFAWAMRIRKPLTTFQLMRKGFTFRKPAPKGLCPRHKRTNKGFTRFQPRCYARVGKTSCGMAVERDMQKCGLHQ